MTAGVSGVTTGATKEDLWSHSVSGVPPQFWYVVSRPTKRVRISAVLVDGLPIAEGVPAVPPPCSFLSLVGKQVVNTTNVIFILFCYVMKALNFSFVLKKSDFQLFTVCVCWRFPFVVRGTRRTPAGMGRDPSSGFSGRPRRPGWTPTGRPGPEARCSSRSDSSR